MLDFLKKVQVKSFILTVLPILIGILVPMLLDEGIITKKGIVLLFLSIILSVGEIFAIILYGKMDKKYSDYEEVNQKYKALVASYKNINDIVLNSADDIYKAIKLSGFSKDYIDYEHLKSNCDAICTSVYELLNTLSSKEDKYTVSIILKVTKEDEEGYITISRKSYSSYRPGSFNTFISKTKVKGYHYDKLFEIDNKEPNYLDTKEKIQGAFLNPKLEYSQYIGIPIICSGNKMIGLLQVISCEESLLATNEHGLKELYNNYLCLYPSLILISDKVEQIREILKSKKGGHS